MGIIASYIQKYATCASCEQAARYGNIKELKRLHVQGHPLNEIVSYLAASKSLECLKYIHKNGCPLDHRTADYAAANNNLECLKYAVENGCPLYNFAPYYATQNYNYEIFKYCFENWRHSGTFWKYRYDIDKIINQINLDDPTWNSLFYEDLSHNPSLQAKVEAKKKDLNRCIN